MCILCVLVLVRQVCGERRHRLWRSSIRNGTMCAAVRVELSSLAAARILLVSCESIAQRMSRLMALTFDLVHGGNHNCPVFQCGARRLGHCRSRQVGVVHSSILKVIELAYHLAVFTFPQRILCDQNDLIWPRLWRSRKAMSYLLKKGESFQRCHMLPIGRRLFVTLSGSMMQGC